MRTGFRPWQVGLLVLLLSTAAMAEVSLPAVFSENMVLQRDIKLPVWGWADAGEKVTVTLAGQTRTATATDGAWRVEFDALEAGGPITLSVAGKNTLTRNNVLVGEVWVCGGQSNMAFATQNSDNSAAEIAAANYPKIRLLKVPTGAADERQKDVNAEWAVCSPDTVHSFTAVGYYFGSQLYKDLDVPIGLIQSCVGGTNASCWTTQEVLLSNPLTRDFVDSYRAGLADLPAKEAAYEKALAAHKKKVAEAKANGVELSKGQLRAPDPPMGPNHTKRPAGLYNAMIAPLQPYAIRGAIWYQGEANAHSPKEAIQYRTLFPAMIQNWRKDWGEGPFPFLFVQLAGYGPREQDNWPLLREAQTMTLSLDNTGMALAIDVGNETNIHPTDKRTVGERLALAARKVAYGQDLVYSGPMYDSMKINGNKAVISFKHTGSGLEVKGDTLIGFTIAGPDKVFVPAKAAVRNGKVTVSAPEVKEPVAVRYAWYGYSECNLYNAEGLPAVPFRTDDFVIE